jgi:hypothetical protein
MKIRITPKNTTAISLLVYAYNSHRYRAFWQVQGVNFIILGVLCKVRGEKEEKGKREIEEQQFRCPLQRKKLAPYVEVMHILLSVP